MIRAPASLVVLALIGCGGSTPERAPASRPVRIADHRTEEEPAAVVVTVAPPAEEGPHADPPPVEPPSDLEDDGQRDP